MGSDADAFVRDHFNRHSGGGAEDGATTSNVTHTREQTQFVQGAHMVATQSIPIRNAQRKGANHVAALSSGDSFQISSVLVDDLGTQIKVETFTVGGKAKAVSGWIRPLDRHGRLLVRPAGGHEVFEQEPQRS